LAFRQGLVGKLPLKVKNQAPKKRYFNYLVVFSGKKESQMIYLKKRPEGDIWQGLYDFPLIETETGTETESLLKSLAWKAIFKGVTPFVGKVSGEFKHQLTHQHIFAKFITVTIDENSFKNSSNYILVSLQNLRDYPIPRLIEQYLHENDYLS
jgi:A/G-specific adenine glycosylase